MKMDGNTSLNYEAHIRAGGDMGGWHLNNCGYAYAEGPCGPVEFDSIEAAQAYVDYMNRAASALRKVGS